MKNYYPETTKGVLLENRTIESMMEEYGDGMEIVEYGEDVLESEELTNKVYETLIKMMVDGWDADADKNEFTMSDIALVYEIGPYVPCVKRYVYTNHIDLSVDGYPGITVTTRNDNVLCGRSIKEQLLIGLIRPWKKPNHVRFLKKVNKTYKYITFGMDSTKKNFSGCWVMYFGVDELGNVVPPYDGKAMKAVEKPWQLYAAQQWLPSLTANVQSDSRYLWMARVREDIGSYGKVQIRLGLNKEHIKSLFYARSLPLTETGRKRPILHWVRAHERRVKEGIDIDVTAHLRGVYQFEMDSLRFEIIQPRKNAYKNANPQTVKEAYKIYAWDNKGIYS